MPEIGIVANPHSKMNKRYPERRRLLGAIAGERGILEVTNTIDDLTDVARRFRDRGVSILAINGGDGTIARTLTAFIREYGDDPLPAIAVLRGGTINVLACNLGLFGTPEQLLYRFVDAHASEHGLTTREVTTLDVNGNLGFLFGNGFTATFLEEFYRNKTGHIGSLWLLAKLYGSAFINGELFRRVVKSLDTVIEIPGQPTLRHQSTAVLCATIERMPMGPRFFPEVTRRPGHFQAHSYTVEPRDLIWHVPRAVLQLEKPSTRVSFCADRMTLRVEGGDLYTLDGELHQAPGGTIEIKTGRRVRFVTLDHPHRKASRL